MQHVLITGTGREMGLGFGLVRRYLEAGDHVIATIRRPSEALETLRASFPDTLTILTMDVGSTASVQAAAQTAEQAVPCLDLLINNAVADCPSINLSFADADLDGFAASFDVAAVGPLRVIKAFLPLLRRAASTALIVNISSEAGSISRCYRDTYFDYGMAKAALNMATQTLHNAFRDEPGLNVICVHPGWIRTNPGNARAPFDPYDHAQTLLLLFESRRTDKAGPVFVDYAGEAFPW